MKKITIYHGSESIIQKPEYGKGKVYNDYGQGFYCTEHIELAKEWACTENKGGFVNQYCIDIDELKVLNLSSNEYNILHWLTLLINHRKFRVSTPVMKRGIEWLNQNFLLDIHDYDLIIGYRADDSYFSFARSFLNNEISLLQLNFAMRLGKLGHQIVLKSRKSFDVIQFQDYITVDSTKYYIKRKFRDDEARDLYRKSLEKDDINGLYIRDIIREGLKANDPRLR